MTIGMPRRGYRQAALVRARPWPVDRMSMGRVMKHDGPVERARWKRAIFRVGRGTAEVDDIASAEREAVRRSLDRHCRSATDHDGHRRGQRSVDTIGNGQPGGIHSGLLIRVVWVRQR